MLCGGEECCLVVRSAVWGWKVLFGGEGCCMVVKGAAWGCEVL